MRAVPAVGGMKPANMRMVVDLPAPLGPRKPNTSPRSTVKDTSSTAVKPPKRLVSFSISISAAKPLSPAIPRQRVGITRTTGQCKGYPARSVSIAAALPNSASSSFTASPRGEVSAGSRSSNSSASRLAK